MRRCVVLGLVSGVAVAVLAPPCVANASPVFPVPVRLAPADEQPRVAIGAGGQIAAAWMYGFRNSTNNAQGHPYNDEILVDTGSALGGAWQTPTVVSAPGFSVFPQVAVDAQGDAAAIWQNQYPQANAIQASYRPAATGAWSAPVTISAPGERGGYVQIVLEPNGDAVAAWRRFGAGPSPGLVATMLALRSATSGAWQAPHEFPAAKHSAQLKIAIDGAGDLFAAWVSESAIEASTQRYGSAGWQAPVKLAPAPPELAVNDLELAVSPAGDAAVVWQQETRHCVLGGPPPVPPCGETLIAPTERLESSLRPASTERWSAPEQIPMAAMSRASTPERRRSGFLVRERPQENPEIAIDSHGDAVVTWVEHGLQASFRPAESSGWQVPSQLSESTGFPYGARYLAIDAAGQALVVWSAGGVIQASAGWAPGGGWQPSVDVTPEYSCEGGDEPHAAVDAAGDAVLLWAGGRCNGPSAIQAVAFNLSAGVPGYRPPEPELTNVRMSTESFRVRRPQAHGRVRSRTPVGTRVRFAVFPDAWVRLAIERLTPGHREGSACVASRTGPMPARRGWCTIAWPVTSLEQRDTAGIHRISFDGSYTPAPLELASARKPIRGRLRYLTPGQYAAILTARNTSGTSWPVTFRFRVVP